MFEKLKKSLTVISAATGAYVLLVVLVVVRNGKGYLVYVGKTLKNVWRNHEE